MCSLPLVLPFVGNKGKQTNSSAEIRALGVSSPDRRGCLVGKDIAEHR
jgi:hypothetical protein